MDAASKATPRRLIAAVVAGGATLAVIALIVTIELGDATSLLLSHGSAIQAIGLIILWATLAWVARRALIGPAPDLSLRSTAVLIWLGSRISFLVALAWLLVPLLIASAIGHEAKLVLLRAFVLVLVTAAFTGIISGAVVNSAFAIERVRRR